MVWLTEVIQEIMDIALEGWTNRDLRFPAYVLVRVQRRGSC